MNKKKSNIKGEYIWAGLSALVAVIGLIVSINSCNVSKDGIDIARNSTTIALKSNEIAKEALLKSEKYFEIDQRPRLELTLEKFKDNDSFIKLSNTTNGFAIFSLIKMQNAGKTPAKDISCKEDYFSATGVPHSRPKPLPSGNVTLAPNSHFSYRIDEEIKKTQPDFETGVKAWDSPNANITIDLTCRYCSEIAPAIQYKTRAKLIIRKSETEIDCMEMH